MVQILSLTSFALAATAAVSGYVVPRTEPPSGWVTAIMEPYDQYHERYVALDCQGKHSTAFFDLCCHPMKADETLATARDASCNPANLSSAVPSATQTAASVASSSSADDDECDDEDDGDDEDDCEDDDGSDAPSNVGAAPPSSESAAAPVTTPRPTEPAPSSTKPSPASTQAAPTSTKAAATSSKVPETTTKPSSTKAPKTSAASPSSTASSGGFDITGGSATFFDQGGAAGSCGIVHQDSDKVVAVQEQRMNSSLCGKKVLIMNTANGKTVEATVADTCPSCQGNANSLDLSHGAFDAIGDENTGVLPIVWMFL
ncbi:RlpA-like double-psi beta-barrel-protein domain-containing protein-containing protein [Amylostereum chailletii]|nr:RlpA-like double-psi beta-barrel-protein domain-containing protein-containing protein [Amylostereum chailletii]